MNQNIPSVVAVVGLPGAGKSEVVALLSKNFGFQPVYFGGVVLEEVSTRLLPAGPESERHVREAIRQELGMAAMAIKTLPKIKALLDQDKLIVIDGIYSLAEWEYLDANLTNEMKVIAVSAHRFLRYSRMSARVIRPLTKPQVDERDFAEIKNLDKARPIVLADFQINNNSNMTALEEQVVTLFLDQL